MIFIGKYVDKMEYRNLKKWYKHWAELITEAKEVSHIYPTPPFGQDMTQG